MGSLEGKVLLGQDLLQQKKLQGSKLVRKGEKGETKGEMWVNSTKERRRKQEEGCVKTHSVRVSQRGNIATS